MNNVYISKISILILLTLSCFSAAAGFDASVAANEDSSAFNIKAYGSKNIFLQIESDFRGKIDFIHGWSLGVLFTLFKDFDLAAVRNYIEFKTSPPYPDYTYELKGFSFYIGGRYYWRFDKLSLFGGGGVTFENFEEKLKLNSDPYGKQREYTYLSPALNIGGQYEMSKKFSISFDVFTTSNTIIKKVDLRLGLIYDFEVYSR